MRPEFRPAEREMMAALMTLDQVICGAKDLAFETSMRDREALRDAHDVLSALVKQADFRAAAGWRR